MVESRHQSKYFKAFAFKKGYALQVLIFQNFENLDVCLCLCICVVCVGVSLAALWVRFPFSSGVWSCFCTTHMEQSPWDATDEHEADTLGSNSVKVKVSRNRPESPEGGRGITTLLDLGGRRGWVISNTPRPLYPRERPGTHCTGC
jgi:hypothetical protein